MSGRADNLVKNRSSDRILVLSKIEGLPSLTSKGLVDDRLFNGGNRLHAIMDPEYGFWSVRYDEGLVPQPLQQRWTSFTRLFDFVSGYFKRRNIEIKEIID